MDDDAVLNVTNARGIDENQERMVESEKHGTVAFLDYKTDVKECACVKK